MRYKEFSQEQNDIYNKLQERQKRYIDYRIAGYDKRDAYIRAGYKASKYASQAANVLETNNPHINSMVSTVLAAKAIKDIEKTDSEVKKIIDNKASVMAADSKRALELINNMSPDEADRLRFYLDILNGKIKTRKRTKYVSEAGIPSYKVEEIEDVKIKFEARKEVDKILGLNRLLDIGKIEAGSVVINIVDSSKKDIDEKDKPNHDIFKKTEEDVIIIDDDKKEKFPTESEVVESAGPKMAKFKRGGKDVG